MLMLRSRPASPRPRRRRLTAALLPAALALGFTLSAGCAGGEGETSLRERCTNVRDHVAALRTSRMGTHDKANPLAGEIDKHQAAMKAALGTAYVDRCETKGAAFADCMLNASSPSDLSACEKGTK